MVSTLIDRRGFVALAAAGAAAAAVPNLAAAATGPQTVAFADGTRVPALGQGSWHMADGRNAPEAAEAAMRLGISLGLALIDTAEIYGSGRSEEMIAKVIAGQRDKVFLVSKVWPTHASADGIERALRASLQRLGTDHLDLYLLHWRQGADLNVVVKTFERLRTQGVIRRWGVSNFSVHDMEDLLAVPGGAHCAANQVLYNLAARDIETDLMPWSRRHKMPIMAYSPLGAGGTGKLLATPALKTIAARRGVPPAAVALAWAMRDGNTIAIVQSGSDKHVREDAAALALTLSRAEIEALDAAFPPPRAG